MALKNKRISYIGLRNILVEFYFWGPIMYAAYFSSDMSLYCQQSLPNGYVI